MGRKWRQNNQQNQQNQPNQQVYQTPGPPNNYPTLPVAPIGTNPRYKGRPENYNPNFSRGPKNGNNNNNNNNNHNHNHNHNNHSHNNHSHNNHNNNNHNHNNRRQFQQQSQFTKNQSPPQVKSPYIQPQFVQQQPQPQQQNQSPFGHPQFVQQQQQPQPPKKNHSPFGQPQFAPPQQNQAEFGEFSQPPFVQQAPQGYDEGVDDQDYDSEDEKLEILEYWCGKIYQVAVHDFEGDIRMCSCPSPDGIECYHGIAKLYSRSLTHVAELQLEISKLLIFMRSQGQGVLVDIDQCLEGYRSIYPDSPIFAIMDYMGMEGLVSATTGVAGPGARGLSDNGFDMANMYDDPRHSGF